MEIEDTAVRLALVTAEFLASAQADNLPDPLQCPLSGVYSLFRSKHLFYLANRCVVRGRTNDRLTSDCVKISSLDRAASRAANGYCDLPVCSNVCRLLVPKLEKIASTSSTMADQVMSAFDPKRTFLIAAAMARPSRHCRGLPVHSAQKCMQAANL